MQVEGKLIITLKSDLCVGSGYAYAGLIDSDICFDKYGIPYIPARRLKGCLKQSAEDYLLGTLLSDEDIRDIFGVIGDNATKGIRLENAYLEEYEQLYREMESICSTANIHQESVLKRFTRVQGQTKLLDGVAEENSLRYTRVLNHYSPLDESEMTFIAKFAMNDAEESALNKLQHIAKATRNIGLKRNRGLGSVSCRIEFSETIEKDINQTSGENEKIIYYTIKNTAPLMLGNLADSESVKYIPGQTMLGYMAGAYLRATSKSSKDASENLAFADLFLNGCTKYSNIVPSCNGKVFFPAPTYINRLKSTKKYVNVINKEALQKEQYAEGYDPTGGNQPKKLADKFVFMDEKLSVGVKEVDTKMVYHHSHSGKSRNGERGILYSLEVVEAMQEFSGWIRTKEKYVPVISGLLQNGRITLGKSKTAQYGTCQLISMSIADIEDKKPVSGTIVVTLCSDAVFMNRNGEYTVYEDEVYALIAEQLGINQLVDWDMKKEHPSMLSAKEVVGYQSTWNLRKMPVPAVCAGSCVVYSLKGDATIETTMVGARNHEGYGHVRIDDYSKMQYEVTEILDENVLDSKGTDNMSPKVGKKILQDILIDSLIADMELSVKSKGLKCSASSLGRITLMLKESLNVNSSPDAAKKDFENRIESIKTKSVKEEARKVFRTVSNPTVKQNEMDDEQKTLMSLLGLQEFDVQNLVQARWGEFAMTVLTLEKYRKSVEKGDR